MNKKIGVGVLSWKAHQTLEKSLQSYRDNGFLDMFDSKLIYFSDMVDADEAIAKKYGWDYAGGPNKGIAYGMKMMAEYLDTDYILLLQNDNPIVEDAEFAKKHIKEAVNLIETGKADMARMRHRWRVGEGFADVEKYLRYYNARSPSPQFIPTEHDLDSHPHTAWHRFINHILRPSNAQRFRGRSVFIEDHPETLYPDHIQREGDFLIIDSSVIDFTDQCLLISRQMWLDILIPYVESHPSGRLPNGFQAPEICINGKWWREQHFKILQGQGVFTHDRKDGSFRPEHHTKKKRLTH